MNIIEINNLNFGFDEILFNKFSLNIKSGEWISICGTNKSGKSILIKLITGLLDSNNSIKVLGKVVNKDNLIDIRKNIGVVFDDLDNYFVCEKVIDDLAFTMENLNYKRNVMSKRIKELSSMLNIENLLYKNPKELSGGEKCKVAIACALVHNPKILILDETLSMIDTDRSEILKLLKSLNKKGITIIHITHDLSLTYLSNRLVILDNGKVIFDDTPLNVMENDKKLNHLGIKVPFEVELSIKLKLYGLIDEIKTNINDLVDTLWE